jgi:SM-20-related protein
VFLDPTQSSSLIEGRMVILDGVLGSTRSREVVGRARDLVTHARPAGTGREALKDKAIRGDTIRWLDVGDLPTMDALFEALRMDLREALWLALTHTEIQLARYLPGARYERHRDAFADDRDRRLITSIYYLNDWHPGDGGELRVLGQDVAPLLDRMVVFRSELVEHEVLPANAERLAITAWFR